MSYTPTTWQTGDTITAEKLNNMESGIDEAVGNAPLVLHLSTAPYDIDAQYADVLSAILAGRSVFLCATAISGSPMYFYASIQDVDADTERITFMSGESSGEERVLKWVDWYKNGVVSLSTVESDKALYINLTPTSPDFSGTTDVGVRDVFAAFVKRKQINFTIESLAAVFPATIFSLFDANNDGIEESAVCGAIVPYNIGGQDVLIKIMTNTDGLTYSTTIYALTPMS